jgi:hypothetical protein
MATMIATSFIELGLRSSPFRIHSVAWRLQFLGGGASVLLTAIFALYLVFAIAAIAGDGGVEYVVAGLAVIGVVLCAGAAGIFSLDILQMKGQVSSEGVGQYAVGAVWVVSRLGVVAVLFLVLAVSAIRTVRGTPRKPTAVMAQRKGGSMLIGTQAPVLTVGPNSRITDTEGD